MRKFALIWSLLIMLVSCNREKCQIVLNVYYQLEAQKICVFKEYENKLYKWEFDYGKINIFKLDHYIYREMIPTNYTLSTESEYYTCDNIFYNYGKNAAIID